MQGTQPTLDLVRLGHPHSGPWACLRTLSFLSAPQIIPVLLGPTLSALPAMQPSLLAACRAQAHVGAMLTLGLTCLRDTRLSGQTGILELQGCIFLCIFLHFKLPSPPQKPRSQSQRIIGTPTAFSPGAPTSPASPVSLQGSPSTCLPSTLPCAWQEQALSKGLWDG